MQVCLGAVVNGESSLSPGLTEDDLLSNFCADLLALSENEPIVAELLHRPRGEWQQIDSLIGSHTMKWTLGQRAAREDLYVTWLDPPVVEVEDFVIVVFQAYSAQTMWSTSALYNRGYLKKTQAWVGA